MDNISFFFRVRILHKIGKNRVACKCEKVFLDALTIDCDIDLYVVDVRKSRFGEKNGKNNSQLFDEHHIRIIIAKKTYF